MQPRTTIFDSKSEKELFGAISGSWEPMYRLYPHVPYANLIELSPAYLEQSELSFLRHTSVDFVVVDQEGKPMLAIEFDGLGQGFSRQGRYIGHVYHEKDPSREWKLGLKVRVANEARFPLVVISYDEKNIVDKETNLTVLHGIVGSFLASQHLESRFSKLLVEHEHWLCDLSDSEADEEKQDLLLAAETDCEMTWNPIVRQAAELATRVLAIDPTVSWQCEYLEGPVRPANCTPGLPGFELESFTKWWHNILRIGCEYTVTTRLGSVVRTVWLRNYEGTGITPFSLLEDLGKLVTMREVLALLSRGLHDPTMCMQNL